MRPVLTQFIVWSLLIDLVGGVWSRAADGTVEIWGTYNDNVPNSFQFNTFPPVGLSNVVALSGGAYHSLALKRDGTVAAWGLGYNMSWEPGNGQNNVPTGLSNVTAISAGRYHNLALKSDGTVVAWG